MLKILHNRRVLAAKRAFSVRRVPMKDMRAILTEDHAPRPGDVVLARVTEIGRLERVELPTGRKSRLYEGDEVILAYGNRYAPYAYEAEIPSDLGECDLAAAGGIASNVLAAATTFAGIRTPTRVQPIGVFADALGQPINVADYAVQPSLTRTRNVPVVAVVGASMNSGKTTTVAGIVRGFANQGFKVGAAKITGTGAGGDLWKFHDAGAAAALDFTDAGMATTYLAPVEQIARGAVDLAAALMARRCDVIVIEIADGVQQRETLALLQEPNLRGLIDQWVFAADSAASAANGVEVMQGAGLSVAAVSGRLTASPLAMREAAGLVDLPIIGLPELEQGLTPVSWIQSRPSPDVSPDVSAAG
jgi:hypothetical protein